ncbi:MAG TPA: hypothetical protein PKB12_07470 [Elusimicrobiota bacterium]|nr:hypothetical protein [Elusimicrobiota bacterium]
MAVRPILLFPDDGLKKVCAETPGVDGVVAQLLTDLTDTLYASPGVMDEKLHLFIAEELTPRPARPEPDEQLQPLTVRLDEAIRMCLSGEIKDAKTITSLLLWERMRGERPA